MSAADKKVAAGSLGNLEEMIKKLNETSDKVEKSKSKKSGYNTLQLWIDMVNLTMKGTLEAYQQLKLSAKISAEDIKAVEETVAKFT